jgi:hypothetical protein
MFKGQDESKVMRKVGLVSSFREACESERMVKYQVSKSFFSGPGGYSLFQHLSSSSSAAPFLPHLASSYSSTQPPI